MKLPVTNIIKETEQAVTVCFKNNRFFNKVTYKPGQFLTLKIPVNGRVEKRAYSFSSNPYTDSELKITVKKVQNGLISTYVNEKMKVGQKIAVEKAMGSFFVEPKVENQKQYLLFAAGSGITPVFSILKSVLYKEPKSKVILTYANMDTANIIFHEELNALTKKYQERLQVEHILSHNDNLNYHSGFITEEIIHKIFKKHKVEFSEAHEYMICGPAGFMKTTKDILVANKIPHRLIKIEAFKPPKIKVTGKNKISKVTIKHLGTDHEIEVPRDKTILQQAMRNNIVLPYSCRSGMCSTCKASCTSGETTMIKGHLLPESEVKEGKILTCVTYPQSDEVTIEIPN